MPRTLEFSAATASPPAGEAATDGATPAPAAAAPEKSAAPKTSGQFSDNYPAKVLLVEDVAMNQKIATMILAKLGYTTDVANNGDLLAL